VVGNHRPTPRALFGAENVTQQVVSGADRPVLVVPAESTL
jgi:nucleotide-binding universal stress UspA family protein